MAFNFIANTASIMSIASSAIEAGELGARNASQAARTAVAIKDIKDYTGDSMLNKSSEKHNAMRLFQRLLGGYERQLFINRLCSHDPCI